MKCRRTTGKRCEVMQTCVYGGGGRGGRGEWGGKGERQGEGEVERRERGRERRTGREGDRLTVTALQMKQQY